MENVTQSSRVILTWNICDHNLEYFINNTSHESYLLHPRPLSTQFKHQCWHQCQFSISIFDVGFSSCKTCHTVSFGGVNCDFRVRNLINYLDIFAAKNAYWQKYWVPTKKLSTEYTTLYLHIWTERISVQLYETFFSVILNSWPVILLIVVTHVSCAPCARSAECREVRHRCSPGSCPAKLISLRPVASWPPPHRQPV